MAQAIFSDQTVAQREELFITLYQQAFPAVAKYVSKMGGSLDEAKDMFQDALVIFYEKMAGTRNEPPANERAYLLGIAKHLWLRKFKDNMLHVPLDACLSETEDHYEEPMEQTLMHYLETAGQKCMELLRAFYYDKLTATGIATRFGYSGVRSATVQKYKCLEKVRETIKERSLAYEDFVE